MNFYVVATPHSRTPLSKGGPTTINREGNAGHVASGGRAEELDQLADFFGLGEPEAGLLLREELLGGLLEGNFLLRGLVLDLLLHQRGEDPARADSVAGDRPLGVLEGDHLGEAEDAVLGGHIGGLLVRGNEAVNGGDIDNAAEAVPLHDGDGVL